MKKLSIIISAISILLCSSAFAQVTDQELLANKKYLASNHLPYPEPTQKQAKAPAGYKPFYLSHYGRHGSRYHYSGADYAYLYETLAKADSSNVLTETGKSLKERFRKLNEFAGPRAGDLTPKGVAQHQGIANRMSKNFPELFKGNVSIEAVASTSTRCVMSMASALEELRAINPKLQISQEASKRNMYYINPFDFSFTSDYAQTKEWEEENSKLYSHINPSRMMNLIFTDSAYVSKNVNPMDFLTKFYEITSSLQSMDSPEFDFNDIWTDEDLMARWKAQNAWWYSVLGNCPLTGNKGITFAKPLLKNILDLADSAIALDTTKNGATLARKAPKANLRYGHDTAIMPLAGLMGIDVARANTKDMENLHTQWNDFRIIPMAANLQLVFFKSAKKGDPILVKAMYNEVDSSLPVPCGLQNEAAKKCPAAPFYRWEDVRSTYRKLLE